MPGNDARLRSSALEAHPNPTVLVDRERRIVLANAAARDALDVRAGRDLGSALHCAGGTCEGCGGSARGARCPLDRVVRSALAGRSARGRAFLLRTGARGEPADLHVLASAAPLARRGAPHAVVVLQDVDALLEGADLLRACAGCGRVEADDGEWYPLHRYLEDRLGVELPGPMCPRCGRGPHPR
jgi:hypothetical protein